MLKHHAERATEKKTKTQVIISWDVASYTQQFCAALSSSEVIFFLTERTTEKKTKNESLLFLGIATFLQPFAALGLCGRKTHSKGSQKIAFLCFFFSWEVASYATIFAAICSLYIPEEKKRKLNVFRQ